MKKLNRKVFLSIFLLISSFLIISILIYNIQTYRSEYENLYRSLTFFEEYNNKPGPNRNNNLSRPSESELDNMMIMNYEVYTVRIRNNSIYRITVHGDESSDFDVTTIASNIMDKENEIKIGNLYNNGYVYNYKSSNTIVIINTKNINLGLRLLLIDSIVFFLFVEVLIYFVSMLLTKIIIKPAEEAFNKQKDFIADASHELKTPLAVIMASSDELKSDKKNAKYVENIKYEADRMNKLITGLLDLSKLENGINIENYKEENISKIIEKIVLTFEAIAFENNVTIESKIESDIIFKCSKEEMEKLISIILDNAIKHSYKDSTIIVNTSSDKNSIDIDITNSGDPIKKGDEEKIFERFYRADKSRKRASNRYGLGLAIAKNIVTNHNGSIKAYSKDNKTTFKINFKK